MQELLANKHHKYKVSHDCSVADQEEHVPPALGKRANLCQRLKRHIQLQFLIYDQNPHNLMYFRSDAAVRQEKKRQYYSTRFYVIHPLSKLRAWYEVYLIFFYFIVLLIKSIDISFVRWVKITEGNRSHLSIATMATALDFMCILDIIVIFLTGYIVQETKYIELRLSKIAAHYLTSLYFFCDLMSSIPKYVVCGFTTITLTDSICRRVHLFPIINAFGVLKIARLLTLYRLINKVTDYLQFRFRGLMSLISFFIITIQIAHWMACLQFAVPRYRKMFSSENEFANNSWIFSEDVIMRPISSQYLFALFKSCAYSLGVYLDCYPINNWEESVLAIMNYIVGRLIMSLTWIVLLSYILSARSLDTKYIEMMNQLNAYMVHKQLPMDLRKRLIEYYKFKYQKSYFNEKFITGILSDTLNNKVNVHKYKFLIGNVGIFKHLNSKAISQVVTYLIPEIFLPNDIIIQSGTIGDSMYFLATGTVAVYTHSGKEVCHLQDGAYFGEISLILKDQKRSATVIAIEISEVYKLERRKFEDLFLENKEAFDIILKEAEARLQQTNKMEEKYTRMIFEQTYKK